MFEKGFEILVILLLCKTHLSYGHNLFFVETFEEDSLDDWHKSNYIDPKEKLPKYNGKFRTGKETYHDSNKALIVESKNVDYFGMYRRLEKAYTFDGDMFILQYEISYLESMECGGSYIKLIEKGKLSNDNEELSHKTPISIMFGPDYCGKQAKFHFIFRHTNEVSGETEEKHAKQPFASDYQNIFSDKKVHLIRLETFKLNQTYKIYVDNNLINNGSFHDDSFSPPVVYPKYIDDPEDIKPADWDDVEMVEDPNDKKPADFDDSEPEFIPDTTAVKPNDWLENEPLKIPDMRKEKPEDWDDDIDGSWVRPLIVNPKCINSKCGKWKPPSVRNPKYKGPWVPRLMPNPNYQGKYKYRQIKNPHYYYDPNPFNMKSFDAVAIELLVVKGHMTIDNIIISDDIQSVHEFNNMNWKKKNPFSIINYMGHSLIIIACFVGAILVVVMFGLFCYISSKYSKDDVKSTTDTKKSKAEPKKVVPEKDDSSDKVEEVDDDDAAEISKKSKKGFVKKRTERK